MVKSALAETPLGPMASSIPSFGAEAASGPAHMNPVSVLTNLTRVHVFSNQPTVATWVPIWVPGSPWHLASMSTPRVSDTDDICVHVISLPQVALMTAISTSQREKLAGGPGGPEVCDPFCHRNPLFPRKYDSLETLDFIQSGEGVESFQTYRRILR